MRGRDRKGGVRKWYQDAGSQGCCLFKCCRAAQGGLRVIAKLARVRSVVRSCNAGEGLSCQRWCLLETR